MKKHETTVFSKLKNSVGFDESIKMVKISRNLKNVEMFFVFSCFRVSCPVHLAKITKSKIIV